MRSSVMSTRLPPTILKYWRFTLTSSSSTRTTQLYDGREDRVTLDEVVKINIGG